MQMDTPILLDAQRGSAAPQSAQMLFPGAASQALTAADAASLPATSAGVAGAQSPSEDELNEDDMRRHDEETGVEIWHSPVSPARAHTALARSLVMATEVRREVVLEKIDRCAEAAIVNAGVGLMGGAAFSLVFLRGM